MPELPEVETIRRGLQPWLEGRVLADVEIFDARLTMPEPPAAVAQRLRGCVVERLERRGKYLLFVLDSGDVAVHHLRMTGSFAATAGAEPPPGTSHVRMVYRLDDAVVVYRDPRRFGTLLVADERAVDEYLARRLGPEPLGPHFTAPELHARLQQRRAPLKAVLLDQRVVAGLGNIYVDEALFLARLHPEQTASSVSRPAAARLREAIRERLAVALEVGGSTLRDYRGVEGETGGMQERFLAYGRAGLPCTRCGTAMRSSQVAGRTSTWCPRCQRRR